MHVLILDLCVLLLQAWDLRKGSAFMDLKHHEDYISSLAVDQAKKILLTARYYADILTARIPN